MRDFFVKLFNFFFLFSRKIWSNTKQWGGKSKQLLIFEERQLTILQGKFWAKIFSICTGTEVCEKYAPVLSIYTKSVKCGQILVTISGSIPKRLSLTLWQKLVIYSLGVYVRKMIYFRINTRVHSAFLNYR